MDTRQYQQSESKKYKSKDPSDSLRREQNTLIRRLEKEQKERMAAMKKGPAPFDPYRDVGRMPAQAPGTIAGPRMPGYEVFGKGYIKKRDEAFVPATRAQALLHILDDALIPEV